MAKDGRSKGIIETSVLVNFLKINRTDLLANHSMYRFVVLDLVRNEVGTKPCYAAQATRLEAALAAGHLLPDDPAEATDLAELAAFAAMSPLKIGEGELRGCRRRVRPGPTPRYGRPSGLDSVREILCETHERKYGEHHRLSHQGRCTDRRSGRRHQSRLGGEPLVHAQICELRRENLGSGSTIFQTVPLGRVVALSSNVFTGTRRIRITVFGTASKPAT